MNLNNQTPGRSSQTRQGRSLGKYILYFIVIMAVAFASAFAGGAVGGLAVYRSQKTTDSTAVTPVGIEAQIPTRVPAQSDQQLTISNTEIETSITQAVEKVGQAVVTVISTIPGQDTSLGGSGDQTGSGSGVIISADGYILTNNHVIEGAKQITVILADGSEIPVSLVSTDIFADLAVLKAESPMPSVAALGNSDLLKPGETVIAIGSPLGDFKNSVTVGVISATGRSIDTGQGYLMEDLLQTDAAINQGNSGGPLVNLAGEVIGINTLIVRGSGNNSVVAEGLGFAISSNSAKLIAEKIIQDGYFSRPYLGIRYQPISPAIAQQYSLPAEYGAYITEVVSDSPAEQAGMKNDDIIVRIGEKTLDNKNSFINALYAFTPGETIEVEFIRGSEHRVVSVVLGEASMGQ